MVKKFNNPRRPGRQNLRAGGPGQSGPAPTGNNPHQSQPHPERGSSGAPRPIPHQPTNPYGRDARGGQGGNRSRGPMPSGPGRSKPDLYEHHQPSSGEPSSREKQSSRRFHGVMATTGQARKPRTAPNPDAVRFVPLGGLEEVGRNCAFYEYKNEIVVVDVGIQFPEEDTPGIDYIIPNVEYLAQNKHKIAGIVLTHGHYDHIAAIHYVIEKLGNPIIYTSKFTKAIVERRHEEFVNAPRLRFQVVEPGSRVKISPNFTAEFFEVEHTIPEAYGFVLETPVGNMVNFADFRLEYDEQGTAHHLDVFEKLAKKGIHTAFMDSTNADIAGRGASEETVKKNLEALMKDAPGRVIVVAFASVIDRIIEIMKIAEKHGRKIALNGRSMESNMEIAQQLGYLKELKGSIITLREIDKHKDNKILVLTTGTQGETNAGFMRIVNGAHPLMKLKPTDTVIFSSSVIPGNERSVQALQDNIARQVDDLYNSKLLDIHVGGHVQKEDVKIVLGILKPQFVVPIHGYYFKRKSFLKTAEMVGMKRSQVKLMDNGQVAEITKDDFKITDEAVAAYYVMVDGLGVGDVEEIVMRDRRSLSQEGMVVIIVTIDRRSGRLLKNPDIISRGFIYLKDNQHILEDMRKRLRAILSRPSAGQEAEPDYLKTIIRDQIGQFLYTKTKRRPMLLPVIIEI